MPDEELIRFAQNESQNLTLDSFHLLKSEFEARGLDLTVIESAQVDKQLAEATKVSEFEKSIAFEFTNTIWELALDEKENGSSDKEIFNLLIQKNINPEYAFMLIESIESRAKELADNFDTEIIFGWILLIIGGLLVLFTITSTTSLNGPIVWGLLLAIGGIIRLSSSYAKKKKYLTILDNIEIEKEQSNMKLYQ
jgi:hypothetical protein